MDIDHLESIEKIWTTEYNERFNYYSGRTLRGLFIFLSMQHCVTATDKIARRYKSIRLNISPFYFEREKRSDRVSTILSTIFTKNIQRDRKVGSTLPSRFGFARFSFVSKESTFMRHNKDYRKIIYGKICIRARE